MLLVYLWYTNDYQYICIILSRFSINLGFIENAVQHAYHYYMHSDVCSRLKTLTTIYRVTRIFFFFIIVKHVIANHTSYLYCHFCLFVNTLETDNCVIVIGLCLLCEYDLESKPNLLWFVAWKHLHRKYTCFISLFIMIIFSSYVYNISSATVYFMAIYSFYLLLLFSFFFERHSSSMRLISVWLLPLLEKITEEICLYCESESFVCISHFKLF